MAYTKQTWVNTVTPLDAEHMNYIEKGIEDAHKALNEITTTGGIKGDPGVGITKITITEEQASGSSDLICKMTFAMSDGTTQEQYFVVPSGTTPVKGKDYYTQADQESIVQQVIVALGTPVFGRVDADNNIILTGELASGTYTLKYEDADGNVTEIGILSAGSGYTNQIPIATDFNGNVVTNGAMYTNARWNSSGAQTDATGYFISGLIPAKQGDVVRIRWAGGGDANILQIRAYESDKTPPYTGYMSFYNLADPNGQQYNVYSDSLINYNLNNGVLDFTIPEKEGDTAYATPPSMAYITVTLYGNPSDCIVTINEPID